MGILRIFIETFILNTSMRGFMKLYKTPHRFLRFLWAVYVISTLSLWTISCYYLVDRYTGFYVTVQQSERIQDITPLPSITVCSQTPMGDHAQDYWKSGTIMSPMQLHSAMQQSMLNAFKNGTRYRNMPQLYAAKDIFYADKVSTYFQNIHINDARRIGMEENELIVFCIMKHTPNNNPSVSHDELCRLSLTWVRHPHFMNCYTITVDPRDTTEISSVSLILRAGIPPPLQAHVFDLFSQSQGFKITLHEPGTHPAIDDNGISVGLGMNTEIRYNFVQHRRLNLGTKQSTCLSASQVADKEPLKDFGYTFNYTFDACMSQAIGQLIRQECNCVSAFHIVASEPTKNKPFCHFHESENISKLLSRMDCVRNINLPHKIAELRSQTCLRRCYYSRYDMQVSSAQWLPTQWQLRLILRLTRAWDVVVDGTDNVKEMADSLKSLTHFMKSKTTLQQLDNSSDSHDHDASLDLNRLTLVTVSRASYNTIVKTETLQVMLFNLLSQIGGLGAVTIGLTITVIFDIIEYPYLLIFNLKKLYAEKRKQKTGGSAEDGVGNGGGTPMLANNSSEDAGGKNKSPTNNFNATPVTTSAGNDCDDDEVVPLKPLMECESDSPSSSHEDAGAGGDGLDGLDGAGSDEGEESDRCFKVEEPEVTTTMA